MSAGGEGMRFDATTVVVGARGGPGHQQCNWIRRVRATFGSSHCYCGRGYLPERGKFICVSTSDGNLFSWATFDGGRFGFWRFAATW